MDLPSPVFTSANLLNLITYLSLELSMDKMINMQITCAAWAL